MSNVPTKPHSLVQAGTHMTGDLTSQCPVVVHGTVDGTFSAPELVVSRTGVLRGTIKVKTLSSEGTLSGEVQAERVQLEGAVTAGTVIKTQQLEVKLAASRGKRLEVTFGEGALEVSDAPVESQAHQPAALAEASHAQVSVIHAEAPDDEELAPGPNTLRGPVGRRGLALR